MQVVEESRCDVCHLERRCVAMTENMSEDTHVCERCLNDAVEMIEYDDYSQEKKTCRSL